jgi:hypothetical protein
VSPIQQQAGFSGLLAGARWGKILDRSNKNTAAAARETGMRRHHEELTAIVPALSLLVPLAGALWVRIKTGRKKGGDQP